MQLDERRGTRAPRQARGRQRVDAVLDAAAALLVEAGPDGVTMHGVARRARTSIGSLYHFFPDREAVLRALGERHAAAIARLVAALRETPAAGWAALDTAAAVERFVAPFLDHLDRHPDLLGLMRLATPAGRERDASLDDALRSLTGCVVAARCPRLDPAERDARAAVCIALLEGVVALVARADASARAALVVELKRALGAYLDACGA